MDLSLTKWSEHSGNPLIVPPAGEFIIADPTFLPPEQSPDGRWHLFAHGVVRGIHHFVSADGLAWNRTATVVRGLRPFVAFVEGRYVLYFESIRSPFRSAIMAMESADLRNWSKPVPLLEPSLPWEGRWFRTNGNPCLVHYRGQYMLYYSAGLVWLKDCGFPEPRYVGVAFGVSPLGPFRKHPEPILRPDAGVPHRNHGAGAIKVLFDKEEELFWGFANGIFVDSNGASRSDIRLMRSADGISFGEVHDAPLVRPEGNGWKKALVYALDVRKVGGEMWMFFNARDGWFRGKERIGLAVGEIPGQRR